MNHLLTATVATLVLGSWTEALGCRRDVLPTDQLAAQTPVVATVIYTERVGIPGYTWHVVAQNTPNAAPNTTAARFHIFATLTGDGCSKAPPPLVGERWVVYIDPAAADKVLDGYPLDFVRPYDVRLANFR